MPRLSDTTPEAERYLRQLLRAMPFERKWRQMGVLYHTGRQLHATGYRLRHPEATPEEIHADWVRQAGFGEVPLPPGGLAMPGSEEAIRVVEHVIGVLDRLGIAYAVSGSWASSIHGVLRTTYDVDLCVEPFAGKETDFCTALGADCYISEPAVRQAVRTRRSFNIIHTPTSFKVDLFVAGTRPFDQTLLARRTQQVIGSTGLAVQMVTPEDVIILKLEWYRLGNELSARQWEDVLGVFRTQGELLDQGYLDQWAGPLGVADLLQRAREEVADAQQP